MDHPDFGRAQPCRCVQPKLATVRRRQMNALGSMEALNDMTFESFHPEGIGLPPERQRTLRAAYETARAFAEHPHGWLLLTGGYGVGKTHLAAAIGNAVIERGDKAIFVLAPDLLDHLRATFAPGSDVSYDELFTEAKNTPLLILDDLGSESTTPWAQEKLFQLLNHRYLRRLPTVITSNRDIMAFEPRLRSRLLDVDLVTHMRILATDYRGGGYVDSLVELSELELHKEQTFESFRVPSTGREEIRNNLMRIRQVAWEYANNPSGWIVFLGRPGVGKTHLAAAIANHVRQRQPEVLFLSIPRLLDMLRATFSGGGDSYAIRFEQIKQAPLLVLDDIQGSSSSPWATEKLFQLIDYRYLTRKPTVFTILSPDGSLDQLRNTNPRLLARLGDESLCLLCYLKGSGRPRRRQVDLGM